MTSTIFALIFMFAIIIPLELVWGVQVPGWAVFLIYFGMYFLVSRISSRGRKDEPAPERAQIPISGPMAEQPVAAITARFTLSGLLSTFNPLQLMQQLAQMGGQLIVLLRLRGNYPDAEQHTNKVQYRIPLEGEWFIMNGGVTPATSHSWDLLAQRYAYDFVQADEQLRRHTGEGTQPADYFCWDQPILAAADGEVVRVRDGVRTAPWLGRYIVDFLGPDFRGNFVVVKHAENEYGFYAHLIRGKMAVKVGDKVKAGQELGRCGHSGHSTEPHLHFQLQDRPNFYLSMGLPIKFDDVLVDGKPQASTYLRGGQSVEQT